MNDVPFHLTLMGRRFFEGTMPAVLDALERLNTNLERLASLRDASADARIDRSDAAPAAKSPSA